MDSVKIAGSGLAADGHPPPVHQRSAHFQRPARACRGVVPPFGPQRQSGAALFISLMFLIVLTLIGLSAANVGVMQERMAGNIRDINIAFQEAEATIRGIEERLEGLKVGGSDLGTIPVWSEFHGDVGVSRGDCTLSAIANDTDNWPWQNSPDVTDAEYLVVQLTNSMCHPITGESPGNPGSGTHHMIAARAFGPANSQAVIQTIYSFQ
ncbi:MAG: PilX N-terminal domain-containing pilus assembly protein [Wenzhouxiangellaceae bacterium]|nr:PilX N-terminal domain-containing pilus assembly protein [Wenzhouxiangellaceae bacterium]